MSERPEGLTFEPSNPRLSPDAADWVQSHPRFCSECDARDGWQPRVWQPSCPECAGDDPYGQPEYCGECEFCCGC